MQFLSVYGIVWVVAIVNASLKNVLVNSGYIVDYAEKLSFVFFI